MALPITVPASTPIAQLNPDSRQDNSSVAGIVTLIWPYAASKSTFSLLLVEPDFRLRSTRGQVRVHFQGSSAKAVARSGISSGDQLLLSLTGAQWVKDSTAATTPGKGIDWQLQYRDRIILQVHRPSQRPIILDIDHPTPSPEPLVQTSTPGQSPPNNNHYASSITRPQPNAQVWASPAFLKRSQIPTTDYDPFIEDDFPDNDRKKRTKFGRGSDQWRFAERTPSPEIEPKTPPFDITSPLRPPAQDASRGEKVQSGIPQAHSTESSSITSDVAMTALTSRSAPEIQSKEDSTLKDTFFEEGEGPSTSPIRVNGGGHNIHEVTEDKNIESIAVITPRTPLPKPNLDEVQAEGSTTGPTSPISQTHSVGDQVPQEPAKTTRASPSMPIEISSSASSSSPPRKDLEIDESDQESDDASHQEPNSLFDEQSESRQSNAFLYSGPGSDIGLDGSTFSRPPPPEEIAPPPNSIRRLEGLEADSLNTDNARDIPSPLQSDAEHIEVKAEEQSAFKHPAIDSSSSEDEASEEVDDSFEDHGAAQRRSSVRMPSSDELGSPDAGISDDQAMNDSPAAQLVISDQGSRQGIGILQDESAVHPSSKDVPSSPHHFGSHESHGKLVSRSENVADGATALETISEQSPGDSPERKSPSSSQYKVDSSAGFDWESTVETSPEKGPIDSKVQQESPLIRQQGIMPETKVSLEDSKILPHQSQEYRVEKLATMTSEVQPKAVEIIDLESGDEDNISPQNVGQKDIQRLVDENGSKPAPTHKVSAYGTPLMLASAARSKIQISIGEPYRQSKLRESSKPVLKPTTVEEEFSPVDLTVEPEAHEEALELEQEGSRPHSSSAKSEGYQERPPSKQGDPCGQSEATLKSTNHELPVEKQSHPNEFVTIKTKLELIPTGELPSTVPDSVDEVKSKSQLLTPSSTQQINFVSRSSSVSLHPAPEDDTLPTPRLTQSTSVGIVPLQPIALSEEPTLAETPAPPKKTSALIEKLKEMRRLSSKSPKPRSSDASILDPWFAPRRVNEVVPDSEDGSETESSPEEEPHSKPPKIVGRQLPQTPEKPLAKSFIRSPSQPKHISSIQSSPQYLPPSQPPPPGFRTNLSYFVPLATLPSHFATTVDVLVIALSSTPVTRATSGPKYYNQSLYVTDPSSLALQHSVTTAQIFRPNNRCFPILEKGAALLLRDFKVQPFEKRLLLLSAESSAWAVFRKGADVQIRGPPVEYGAEERGFARGLWDWWASLGDDARKRLENAVPEYKKPSAMAKATNSRADRNKVDALVRNEEIEGLGVDLPGSQSKRRESMRERSLALDGVEEKDTVYESIEAPKRVLRARSAKGANGRSESARESRFGTVFTGGLGEPDETQGSAHELRDGKAYKAKGR